MTYQLPTLKTYLAGLLVLTIIALTATMMLPTFGIENSTIYFFIIASLLVGHLVGTAINERPSHRNGRATAQRHNNRVKTVYVGNLSFETSKHDLYNLFRKYGKVHSSRVMFDRVTRKSRGFGFVEMNSDAADEAIADLDGVDFSGRNIRVNEATNQTPQVRNYQY
jgi:hypothetical protein